MLTDAIHKNLGDHAQAVWDESITDEITEYIKIPALSPHFDADWAANGNIDKAVAHIRRWCASQPIAGLSVETVRLEGRTPVLFMEIPSFPTPGVGDTSVLLYGHLDKQPEMSGWDEDKGPWIPVREGDKLYGRGGADDGYAAYASLTAIAALQKQGVPHARCVVLIEGCEESGSYDLPPYVDHLRSRLGEIDLVVCLDSGCGNYEQLWSTTSLRGLVAGQLSVEVLEPPNDGGSAGVHSGDAGGVVPSSFRVLRALLERVQDTDTGAIKIDAFNVEIPEARIAQAKAAAEILGDRVVAKFPLIGAPVARGHEAVLNRTWRPALEVVGIDGIPDLRGGNVLRGKTVAKLSMRLPPTGDSKAATAALKEALEADPPYGARVTFTPEEPADGWNAPALAPWLEAALMKASRRYFDRDAAYMGEGGTIPFMGMLGEKFPNAQFVITGVLGPGSNAHGPNEFLHVPMATKLTACMSSVLADHRAQQG